MIFIKGKYPKKYTAIFEHNNKIKKVSFGDVRYEHYKDRTPIKLYSDLDHLDDKRRMLYHLRHSKDYPKYSADWFSKKFLW
jgi:hypothetical protein